jgi:hypothetical protein
VLIANAPGDQLSSLAAKIENQNLAGRAVVGMHYPSLSIADAVKRKQALVGRSRQQDKASRG